MIGQGPFIAVDWGSTNRRAWRIAPGGRVEDTFEDGAGILTVPAEAFAAEAARLRERLGDWPMLLGGMIGSNRGWREVPYVPCPASARDIAAGIAWVDARTGIVPGVCQTSAEAPEVMRGEEVQIIGALASKAMPDDALVCLPGTHAKWVRILNGSIASFSTWMTGEIFALLSHHSILAPQMDAPAQPGPAFAAGVEASGSGDPLARLFRLRAAAALHAPMSDGASYISGLLIGAELRSGLMLAPGAAPFIIGRPDLGALYAAALAQVRGRTADLAQVIDGTVAFRAGISALIEELP